MLVENLSKPIHVESRNYLKIVDRSVKNAFSFFYIGQNELTIKYLSQTFKAGLSASDFLEAQEIITSTDFTDLSPDVVIIDLPFSESQLRSFNAFLSASNNSKLPIIYNDHQFPKGSNYLKYASLVDDVFDIYNGRVDYASKVSFLKAAKSYQVSLEAFKSAKEPSNRALTCYYKRAFDILVSSLLLIILSPLLLMIAIIIKCESKGPIFYTAKRAGKGFKVFEFYKFRTMEVNADQKIEALSKLNQYNVDSSGPVFFKISNDPRITRAGKVLRNSSLDELPQLFNVLKGDMSLVGNRPLPLYEASTLTTNEYVERFMAPSGMTGLWQIKKRGKADMSIDERISLDIDYARKSNLLYDFWIMARTPAVLLQKDNV
jgi:lipopolysaccharide/colanic/teichoic acid biosynthesis glycosyltransferase